MDILTVRKQLHDYVVDHVFDERPFPNKLSGKKIEQVFNLYDEYFFGHQIRKKVEMSDATLRFYAKGIGVKLDGYCGVKRVGCDLKVYIPSFMMRTLCYITTISELYEDECDYIYALQFLLEHITIHIIMVLWGYYKKGDPVYGENGPLYHCLLETYFGYDVNTLSNISMTEEYNFPLPTGKLKGLMTNWEESCYLDSLIMALFLSSPNYYRERILNVSVKQIKYSGEAICSYSSKIQTAKAARALSSHIQRQLREDYERILLGKKTFECSDTRKLLSKCLPEMIERGRFVSFNTTEVYAVLASLFPNIKMNGTDRATYTMWDFMEYESPIQWYDLTSKVLVFQNSVSPPIEYFDSEETEYHKVYGPIPGEFEVIDRSGEKVEVPKIGEIEVEYEKDSERVFGEYILDGTYRLFAVIMHHGQRPKFEWTGAGHYNVYLRPIIDPTKWYYYDDMKPTFRMTDDGLLPPIAMKDDGTQRPEMFLYERISPIEVLIKYRDDGYAILFAINHTEDEKMNEAIEKIKPRYITKATDNAYMWRVLQNEVGDIQKKLDQLSQKMI